MLALIENTAFSPGRRHHLARGRGDTLSPMTLLMLGALLSLAQKDELRVPEGWQGGKQEGAFVAAPKDLEPGKLYTLLVPELRAKLGSLTALLDAAKATLGEAGTFTPLHDPARAKNEGGWDYDVLIGTLEKDGKKLVAQAVVLRKGEEEVMMLVVSDSVETMRKYADPFTAMVRGYGAPKAVEGSVDLVYKLPEGWAAETLDGGVLLKRVQDTREYRLLILASRPLGESLQKAFRDVWTAHVTPTIETSLMPLPLMCRLKSGMACAADIDAAAKTKAGVQHHGGLYVLARGSRCVPILAFYFGLGNTDDLEKGLHALFESADIPGSGAGKVALSASAATVAGTWTESSAFYGNYVTRAGAYAGDASVATGATFEIKADGTFKKTAIAVSATRRIKEVEEGTWTVDDAELLLKLKESTKRYRIFGTGADPKVGAFLVLSTYNDTDERVSLPVPRRTFSGTWYKRKD
jgi:hypothetical protein